MRLLSWLPGISAAARLGISEENEKPVAQQAARVRDLKKDEDDDEAVRLPQGDIFYWSMLHSHL